MQIAILITSHNRKLKTLESLRHLFSSGNREKFNFDVFLVDDGSTDGTSGAIKEKFPEVNVIKGNGELYWNQGMRLAWKTALERNEYDFFIWLNDDAYIDPDAIFHILECYNESLFLNSKHVIVTGACRAMYNSSDFSYGLRGEDGPLLPNGDIQYGQYMNGNFVLVPVEIVDALGILSADYTHAMGDFDYGLRALKLGFHVITTKKYIATCPVNTNIPIWCNSKKSLLERWRSFHSPLGLNIKEYKIFCDKFLHKRYYSFVIKAYIRCLMPVIYNSFAKKYKKITNNFFSFAI